MNTYEITIDYQTPADKELCDSLVAYGFWGKEERERKEPHALHTVDYAVEGSVNDTELKKLKQIMTEKYTEGGYVIRDITFKKIIDV